MEMVTVSNLTKIYGTGETATRALDNVSFSIAQGEFVAIVGSSGSGKSTLLHLMGGVDRPTSGTVCLSGENVYARSDEQLAVFRRREVGIVYQFYNLIPVLNVVENMTLPVALDGRPINEERDRPTSGTVCLSGENVYARSDEQLAVFRRREVGIVYQFYNLIPVLNVVENMTLPVALDGRPINEERLRSLIEALGLRGREAHLPSQLSGGQQQRVAIGRALMNRPSVILADEPTGNLDSRNSADIMALLRSANKDEGQTLVVITHDEDIALSADRIIAIEDGGIVRDERIRK